MANNKPVKDMTESDIKRILTDIFNRPIEPKHTIVCYQHCKTYGWVDRGSITNELCDDPSCSCVDMKAAMKEALDGYDLHALAKQHTIK